ncbi:uncharacterized protein LOC142164686 [Nicotiana tabacum]|uniref:Uncharacterized protein LOC142164686 n=1 Tax=Nicotiana tabacum TaxID=4097 RepID=A0AC58S296_TOBAC
MPKRSKSSSSDINVLDNNSVCVWSNAMDDALIDAFHHQHILGNRVGGTFTSHALDNIVNELQSKFPDKIINKERVHNRMRLIKRQFGKCYDMFQNGMSGFAWDPNTNTWNAESEVWDQLIQAKPEAAELRNKPIRNYDKLIVLYGKDRATGKHAETGSDMLKRSAHNNSRRSSTASLTIDEVDELISMNVASLENTEKDGQDEQEQTTPKTPTLNAYSEAPISNKNKNQKQDHLKGMTDMLRGGMDNLANAINRLSTMPPILESEIWQMVKEMNLEPRLVPKAYIFLCQHADLCRTLIGCPWEDHKIILLTMMSVDN